ncbi:asparagine synthase-domain-containing protein [Clohesyomyces aquaticus]|uniref:Asparagine synthase-domain-containing protein n=1 Tax=Clohesyomyces aquaticus TaxID=1231657 RepID=A0A1Y1ZH65_9PLEO|nr:asparagine synthase-domain-containing protein [Clohesyomyces aquaticus]
MCGIFFSLSRHGYVAPTPSTEALLRNRGPDSIGKHEVLIHPQAHATFLSTVLSLRGTNLVKQPLKDVATQSILCWNGEAWKIGTEPVQGNDAQLIFDLLLKSSSGGEGQKEASIERVVDVVSTIRGPFAFVFFDAPKSHLYYGRDCLGRRSLLLKSIANGDFILSSVCDNDTEDQWSELDADGLYVLDLKFGSPQPLEAMHIPSRRRDDDTVGSVHFPLCFPFINKSLPGDLCRRDPRDSQRLLDSLRQSLDLRIQHVREAIDRPNQGDARVAILFSGGLDCTVLTRICHDLLPLTEGVDLLNVAFQNPRIHANLEPGVSPFELCPDRVTGRSSYTELLRVCPGRPWRFVAIDVPYSETTAHRQRVITLMHPHNTEMDLSISFALYFASRGSGFVQQNADVTPELYSTSAHVLLSGLGADELFGGYQRHATAFSRRGHAGLVDELELDFDRLGKRNLGRDDRVISDSGKEVRFPFLDEDVIALALELPVWAKCDFENEHLPDSDDPEQYLEPAKKILRLVAWEVGMKGVAGEKKRAIQFGARTAKMETGKTKGTQVLE